MNLTHRQRKKRSYGKKEINKLVKKLRLSNFTYVADDKNMTYSPIGHQLIDFFKVIG